MRSSRGSRVVYCIIWGWPPWCYILFLLHLHGCKLTKIHLPVLSCIPCDIWFDHGFCHQYSITMIFPHSLPSSELPCSVWRIVSTLLWSSFVWIFFHTILIMTLLLMQVLMLDLSHIPFCWTLLLMKRTGVEMDVWHMRHMSAPMHAEWGQRIRSLSALLVPSLWGCIANGVKG